MNWRISTLALGLLLSSMARADVTIELEDLIGYTIIESKTIESWYDDDEKDDSFEGCSHGRVIVFTDNTTLTCAEYGYQYAYRPTAIILAKEISYQGKSFYDFKMVVEDAVAAAAMRHRLILNFEAEAEGITTDLIITQILKDVPKNAEAVGV